MEHPDVIREIDALIDSYNWGSLYAESDSASMPELMKKMLRTNSDRSLHLIRQRFGNYYITSSEFTLVVTQILLTLLENPHLRDKVWVFKVLSSTPLIEHNRDSTTAKLYRIFLNACPLLKHLLNHHRAKYRMESANILAERVDQPTEVAQWLLARLKIEKSPHVICYLLRALGSLLQLRRSKRIDELTREAIIIQARRVLKHRLPLVRMAGVTLCIQLFKQRTPSDVEEALLESWSQVSPPEHGQPRTGWIVIGNFLEEVRSLGEIRAISLYLQLLSRAKLHIMLGAVLEVSRLYRLSYCPHNEPIRCIALTPKQKLTIEILLKTRAFWQGQKKQRENLEYYGLEPIRADLRQQIKHARIEDDPQQFSQAMARFPLSLMKN